MCAPTRSWSDAPEPRAPLNLLLLVAEDMSARVGAFGDPVAATPNLDRLAREGTRFTRVFTAAPVCAPSRAALVTGLHPISIGAQHMRTSSRPAGGYAAVPPPEVKAFPELLRRAGWFTFTDAKLDYQFSGVWSGTGPSTIWSREGASASWRERTHDEQPFFGLLNFGVTHESGVFPALFEAWPHSAAHLFMQLARAWVYGIPDEVDPALAARIEVPPSYPDTPSVRRDLARHYANIQQMDAQVGEILAQLEADGLADSTLVVWTTDHGDGLPRSKRDLTDGGLHVPLIVRWPEARRPPEREPGDVDDRLVSFVDIAPTLLAQAGLEPPPWQHGRSFLGDTALPRRLVFASRDRVDRFPDRERAVRDARFGYIWSAHPETPNGHPLAFRDNIEMVREMRALYEAGSLDAAQRQWFEPTGRERLYDLETDPHEVRNLVDSPAHAQVLARMRRALADWQARVPDWSLESEAAMVERMWPGGVQPVTAPPSIRRREERVELACATPGASIEYRIGEGPWRVYAGPFEADGARVTARAVRYGYAPSDEVEGSPGTS
ncbi:MAG: sulfatase family protein [Myxococcota bacterium]